MTTAIAKSAVLSPCGTYRYELERCLTDKHRFDARILMFVMLNPSTADAEIDDPTIRKCMGFAERWGYDIVRVGNLFAYRATDPKALIAAGKRGVDVVGPENNARLGAMSAYADKIIVAWGTKGTFQKRAPNFPPLLIGYTDQPLWALRVTKDGHPMHPLYVPYDAQPVRWGQL